MGAGADGGMTRRPPVDLGIEGITDATRVGQGGFGTVYRARQTAFGRTVAVKVLSTPGLDESELRRFEQECRAIGALSGHPHVVAVYDTGHTAAGQPYLVLDYLPGGTLADRVEEFGPLPWDEVADAGVKLAGALAAAHAAGVLHRDVKPENVLVSSYDEPQLTDFGVARVQGGTQTHSGVITGSLAHAAPEVLSGRPATEASDVYSLASTLYALAAGHAPFVRPDDESFHPLLNRIMSEAPPDLRPQGVPTPMWEALAAALAKDPSARTSSARAFGEALRAAQRAGGLSPTRMVVPDPVAVPSIAGRGGDASVTRRWGRPRSAAPVPAGAVATGGVVERGRSVRPAWMVALVVAILGLLAASTFALAREDGDEDGVAVPASTTVPVSTTIAPTSAATAVAPQRSTAVPPSTAPAPTTTRPASPATTARGSPPTSATAGGTPVCNPSFFRATVTSERPRYNNGDTVQVSARFENISGRPCSYTQTCASSQLLNPFGEALGPIRTLVGDNVDNIPFEPGTSQTFRAAWEVNTCASPTTCYPGRYTITMNVVPFGGGQASFDVA